MSQGGAHMLGVHMLQSGAHMLTFLVSVSGLLVDKYVCWITNNHGKMWSKKHN